ncbi:MAG: methyltransferase type 11, partial [bacterium]
MFNPECNENTYSHGIMGLIAAFVPGHEGVTEEEAKAWTEDLRKKGEEGAYFFSLNRYMFVAVKPE